MKRLALICILLCSGSAYTALATTATNGAKVAAPEMKRSIAAVPGVTVTRVDNNHYQIFDETHGVICYSAWQAGSLSVAPSISCVKVSQ